MTETDSPTVLCTQGWEALRGDSLAWLLDETRPNLHWRVLVELVGRPPDSPAVVRARGGANAREPIAGLLAELLPDGVWATEIPLWSAFDGPGWRLIAAVQWGADPADPRLHAASERILETAAGDGGLAGADGILDTVLTARALDAMTALGWNRHPRVQEWLAWFDDVQGWERDPSAAVCVIRSGASRPALRDRALDGLDGALARDLGRLCELDHPSFLETDLAEIFGVLAGAGATWSSQWRPALERLQGLQDEKGRWSGGDQEAERWITLHATKAMLAFAVDAGLPRLFPQPPPR